MNNSKAFIEEAQSFFHITEQVQDESLNDDTRKENLNQLALLYRDWFCFYLNIDYDSLPGEGKGGKTRELIIKLEKEGRLPDLFAAIEDLH